ncbi:M50 family metallopeptidase [Nocardioides hwasunensis]|uniref:Site-2 protease family protein n=1 Tax=Nocardioides hwasunensis TaxID=397258 RepID=A0ABR8MF10_9ACTN|nr:site-2 protease family protein [Nocardioides hwasunensis]MBD3913312.1 site-2 protease family protein [Nocardioides hwasunensis]
MTPILYTLGVVSFVVAILVSIGLHEFGHLIPAKKFGCKVPQWFIGFGPTVWSRQIGDTEYGVKAIPLGGYVKIVGMLPPGAQELVEETTYDEDGEAVHKVRRSNTGMFTQLISDARAAEWEYVKEHDTDRLFYRLAWWKKVIVMAGGPMVNIAIAFSLFVLLFATYGNPRDEVVEPTVAAVPACVIPVEEQGRACTADDPPTPAKEAGIQPGDEILSFNGTPFTDWDSFQKEIRGNADGDAVIEVRRDGQTLTLTTNTTVTLRQTSLEDDTLTEVGFLGVQPDTHLATGGPIYTAIQMGTMTVETGKALAQLPVKVYDVGRAIVGLQERDPESPVSIVGGGRFAGEAAASDAFPITDKLVTLLFLVASFNFFIGMFNFVPLLPLDGGHIAGALFEGLKRGLARLRGRPDPGHVDVAKLLPVAYVVGLAMLVMGVILIVADIVVPLRLS